MKKANLVLSALVGFTFVSVNSKSFMETIEHPVTSVEEAFGYGKEKATSGYAGKLDTEAFWAETASLYNNNKKYGPNHAFTRHAQSELHRVQTLHAHKGKRGLGKTAAKARHASSYKSKRGAAPETKKTARKRKGKEQSAAEKAAYKKGVAHQAYRDTKKAKAKAKANK